MKMSTKWIVIGISGATCGGKSTLCENLSNNFGDFAKTVCQDHYFLLNEHPNHILVPELNHNNWEILSSLDMQRMDEDIINIYKTNENLVYPDKVFVPAADVKINCESVSNCHSVSQVKELLSKGNMKLLILEGFLVLNHKPIEKLCNLKYYLTLEYNQCWERRKRRIYEPPDVPGYFDLVVWPEYVKHRDAVFENVEGYQILDGDDTVDNTFRKVISDLYYICKNR